MGLKSISFTTASLIIKERLQKEYILTPSCSFQLNSLLTKSAAPYRTTISTECVAQHVAIVRHGFRAIMAFALGANTEKSYAKALGVSTLDVYR